MTPSDDRPDLPGQPHVTVPDDARDLHRDLLALQRERRAANRRRRVRRLFLTRRWDRFGLSGPLVVAVLLGVAGYAALPVLLRPTVPAKPQQRPLATPIAAAGRVGGLLPDGPVTTPAGSTTTRELIRPTALLLVPLPCGCEPVLASAVSQLAAVTRDIRLIATRAQDPGGTRVGELRTGPGRGQVDAGIDERGVLTAAYAPSGVTLVLVAPDGVVADVVRDLQPRQRLDVALERLRSAS